MTPAKRFISLLTISALLVTPTPTAYAQEEVKPQSPAPSEAIGSDELHELLLDAELVAANGSSKKRTTKKKTKKSDEDRPSTASAPRTRGGSSTERSLSRARQLASEGKYQEASKLLFQLSRSPQYAGDPAQIKYLLGLMLYEMKMYQTAAFIFYDVVKTESRTGKARSKYLRQALEKLSLSADALDSDVLLRYAIKKIDEEEFPAQHRDMLYYRTAELKMGERDFQEAARVFGRVRSDSAFFSKAKYKQALSYTEAGDLDKALKAFDDLADFASTQGITDVNRVSGLLGKARILYQKQNWDGAIEAYREVPRDTDQWHEALFESSWAMLRSARFRSALSNFHSLHSEYYEDVYQPESLLLRAIVYLFICRYDEMEKVLTLFERIHKPVARDVKDTLNSDMDPRDLYKELSKVSSNFNAIRANRQNRRGYRIPFLVARKILKEGDVRRNLNYIAKLEEEKRRINGLGAGWAQSAVGRYAKQVVDKRLEATQTVGSPGTELEFAL